MRGQGRFPCPFMLPAIPAVGRGSAFGYLSGPFPAPGNASSDLGGIGSRPSIPPRLL